MFDRVNGEGNNGDRSVPLWLCGTGGRPMPRKPAPGTRDRILDSATRLFQEHGVRAVGTQQIVDECGCGKKLLYGEFATKDELVVAYLERCQQEWSAVMDEATRTYAEDPARQLVAM